MNPFNPYTPYNPNHTYDSAQVQNSMMLDRMKLNAAVMRRKYRRKLAVLPTLVQTNKGVKPIWPGASQRPQYAPNPKFESAFRKYRHWSQPIMGVVPVV